MGSDTFFGIVTIGGIAIVGLVLYSVFGNLKEQQERYFGNVWEGFNKPETPTEKKARLDRLAKNKALHGNWLTELADRFGVII